MVGNVDIVSAIKTDHSAITLQLHKIYCIVLYVVYVAYIDEVKEKILIWREVAKEILEKRVIWDWIEYNVRLYSTDYSKRRAKANREEEEKMQNVLRCGS